MTTTPHQATEPSRDEETAEWTPETSGAESSDGPNVGKFERIASGVLGGAIALQGLRRRGLRGLLMAVGGGYLMYRGASGQCGLYSRAGIDRSGSTDSARPEVSHTAPEVQRSITVGRPAEELHEYWRDAEQLNQLLGEFATIEERSEGRLHWTVNGPLDRTMEWETEFVEDREGEVLRWETVEGTRLPSEWTVRYQDAPGEQGTEVSLRVRFDPPGGAVGSALIERLGIAPKTIVAETLRRFRSLAETGEVPTLERNPSARGSGDLV